MEADNGAGVAPRTFYVDVLLILERDGCVLLAERSGTGYADGAYNLPRIAQYRVGSPFSLHGFGFAPEPAAV